MIPIIIAVNVVVGFFEVKYLLRDYKTHPFAPKKKGEPIPAWKFAGIHGHEFCALTGGTYRAEATYQCTNRGKYRPHRDKLPKHCTCGFYAYRTMGRAIQERWAPNLLLLRVELYGTVHEGAFDGYRAEKQRVLCAYAFCAHCHQPAAQWVPSQGLFCLGCFLLRWPDEAIVGGPYGDAPRHYKLTELAGELKTEVLPATKEMSDLVRRY